MLPNLNVVDNIFLGQELAASRRLLDRGTERTRAHKVLDELGLGGIDLETEASELSVAERQLVEIARALVRDARLLILDEPSAVLAGPELESLFASLRRLVSTGGGGSSSYPTGSATSWTSATRSPSCETGKWSRAAPSPSTRQAAPAHPRDVGPCSRRTDDGRAGPRGRGRARGRRSAAARGRSRRGSAWRCGRARSSGSRA